MRKSYRLNFIVDQPNRLIVIRPIGDMPAMEFVDSIFEGYAGLSEPWTYRRVNDFRRFEGVLDQGALDEIARRWAALTAGIAYRAFVAVITSDFRDHLRLPAVSPQFPNETICLFSDYHEAVGWLLEDDRDAYLSGLGAVQTRRRDADKILIQ